MRLLIVTPVFPPAFVYGGPPLSVYGLAKGLVNAGHDVLVLSTTANGQAELDVPTGREIVYQGVRTVFCRRIISGNYFFSPQLRDQLHVRAREFEVVLGNGIWNYISWAVASVCGRSTVPYCFYPRGSLASWTFGYHRLRKTIYWSLVERRNYESASAVIALTQGEAQEIRQTGLKAPIAVIPNGIWPEEYDRPELNHEARRVFPDLREGLVILFMGRLHVKKGLDSLITAYGELRKRHRDAKLVLVGPDDGAGKSAAALVERLGLKGNVMFIGMVTGDVKVALLKRCDIFVLASRSEGMPVSVLEAMACSKPVVISQGCNLPQVGEARAGIVVKDDPDSLLLALKELAGSAEKRDNMGLRARMLVEKHFTWDIVACETINYLKSLQGKPGR